jgi:alkanesulfonate monooxygenase SsuD/methylene tetrahydromethanopterin reductase-like flavin-dependent oxidoreductase (luciferase family)
MTKFSLLDLVPVVEGGTVATALANAADLAQHCEKLGFTRYWVAEHHGMRGIASAATSVVIAHIAAATQTIRVGSGGIMLPNHAPLVIAEQFGTLDALYPGRIDLGLGRAPGSDQRVATAIRRTLDSDPNAFPRDVMELQSYFADDGQTGIVATPGAGAHIQLYILGSSLYGAQVAAALGLPFAFASHFAPDMLDEAFIAAPTDAEAAYLASSMQQSFVSLRTGNPRQMPAPVEGYYESLAPQLQGMLDHVLSCSAFGAPESVKTAVTAFVDRTKADEIIVACSIFDHEMRKRSLELVAEILNEL